MVRVCFFARLLPGTSRAFRLEALERAEFYKQDIEILGDLGFDVTVATCWDEIPRQVDFYFVWWWNWAFLPLAKAGFGRQPCIITGVFDYQMEKANQDYVHRPAWQRWLMRVALENAAANVFLSDYEFRQVTAALKVHNPFYVPLVVDAGIFRPGTGPREEFILSIARMHTGNARRKSFPEIIRAIPLVRARHPQMRFVFAGYRGGDTEYLESLAQRIGVSDCVEFPGAVSREKKIELMQRCRVFLSPSRHEGFGLAILEAMSCGAPVVSSPAGAVPEVLGDTGLQVDGTSPQEIADAVNIYLDSAQFREEMGSRARQRAETVFPYARRKESLEQIIKRTLENA